MEMQTEKRNGSKINLVYQNCSAELTYKIIFFVKDQFWNTLRNLTEMHRKIELNRTIELSSQKEEWYLAHTNEGMQK